jgi:hypothetical protein
MGRIALQDLGHSERELTYTEQEGVNPTGGSQIAKKAESDEQGRSVYR